MSWLASHSLAATGLAVWPTAWIALQPKELAAAKAPVWAALAPPLSLELKVRKNGRWIALAPQRSGSYCIDWRARSQLRAVARLAPSSLLGAGHYRMWLESYDEGWAKVDWVDPQHGGGRDFDQLRPGQYRLWVTARPGWGGAPYFLGPVMLEVGLAPWLRCWAWPGYALLALALVVYGRRRWLAGELAGRGFLRGLEHELKTPLVAIGGLSELLLKAPLPVRERRCVLAIHQAGEFMRSLLGEGSALEEGMRGDTPLQYQCFDPAALCREVIDCLCPQAVTKGLRLRCRIEPDLPLALYGDARRIRQVLWNLLANALKFTHHGEVGLDCAWRSGACELSVCDTGPGIPAAQRRRVFRAFTRLDGRAEGRGLGLTICRVWVRRMGGAIRLEALTAAIAQQKCCFCGEPAHGTRVQLRLPLRRADTSAAWSRRIGAYISYLLSSKPRSR